MQPVGSNPWFDRIRPFELSHDLFLAFSFSVCAEVKVKFSTMPGWRANSPPLKVPSPGLYILSKSCLRFFLNLSQVTMFWVFFFFHISSIIFYLFQLGLKYVENNLLIPERWPQGPWFPHQVVCVSAMSWAAHRKAVVEVLGSETHISCLEATEDRPLPSGLERRMLLVDLNYLRERWCYQLIKRINTSILPLSGLGCRSDNWSYSKSYTVFPLFFRVNPTGPVNYRVRSPQPRKAASAEDTLGEGRTTWPLNEVMYLSHSEALPRCRNLQSSHHSAHYSESLLRRA